MSNLSLKTDYKIFLVLRQHHNGHYALENTFFYTVFFSTCVLWFQKKRNINDSVLQKKRILKLLGERVQECRNVKIIILVYARNA